VERPGVINPSGREEGARKEKTIHLIVQLSTYTVYGNYFEQKFTLQSLISKIIFPARKGSEPRDRVVVPARQATQPGGTGFLGFDSWAP
jgi:hypothetical protein